MELEGLGYEGKIATLITADAWEGFELARVIVEHKERYIVQTVQGTYHAEITGNLRFSASSRRDFPAVGDWVKVTPMDENSAVILEVFPRTSLLERQAVGKHGETQIIATNIDVAFIVQAVGHDYNLKRIERYMAICHASDIKPLIILTKIDLVQEEEVEKLVGQIKERIKHIQVIPLSNETQKGFDQLHAVMYPHKTYCFLGSSGVGKSTIINHLCGQEVLKTSLISSSTNKGRHTTSHRELMVLPNKSIVIDTPGMREVGMTDQAEGIEMTYDEIVELAEQCKFNDCTHTHEVGCAVLEAVNAGEISQDAYDNYLKLKREQSHFSSTLKEKRQKSKEQGKLYKAIQAEKRKHKY
ncbi:ribosome biogenesis GTPase [Catalinimonas alkaloidigena]|uniref:ribosome small subunit-dependent GTPase A n=1 Tax=Catalinimonas alkaloidigena TaxID=1075417 RepID=UPI0024073A60|nr:ribosome small subunit-dependent GTPase A [Catalinimonas alkaloidigena]MDF9798166.1 ribosome biogenesis GTPase [Catalinimonas alkaloidigena]